MENRSETAKVDEEVYEDPVRDNRVLACRVVGVEWSRGQIQDKSKK